MLFQEATDDLHRLFVVLFVFDVQALQLAVELFHLIIIKGLLSIAQQLLNVIDVLPGLWLLGEELPKKKLFIPAGPGTTGALARSRP